MKWLVLGCGISGAAAARLLARRGHSVRVSDARKIAGDLRQTLEKSGIEILDQGNDPDHLDESIQAVCPSPGVPFSHPIMQKAVSRGIPIVSEIDLALEGYRGKLIAVTGTNGKSTVTAMLGHALETLGYNCSIGGNFGIPPSQILLDGPGPDHLVLELSSYQLEQSNRINPDLVIFTGFSPDHSARHGTLEAYFQAKWRVFSLENPARVSILNDSLPAWAGKFGHQLPAGHILVGSSTVGAIGTFVRVSQDNITFPGNIQVPISGLHLQEQHNILNAAMVAAGLSQYLGRSPHEIIKALATFRGLAHRCERIGTIRGHAVINDSKSTNADSTLTALASLREPAILMMGGQGKGESYAKITDYRDRIRMLITFGASGPEIESQLKGSLRAKNFPTLAAALIELKETFSGVDCPVLFSPGCASFDEFRNFEHRGDYFRATMQPLLDQTCIQPSPQVTPKRV